MATQQQGQEVEETSAILQEYVPKDADSKIFVVLGASVRFYVGS